jgi:O-antigen ligase
MMLFALGAALPLETLGNVQVGPITLTLSRFIGIGVLAFGFLDLFVSGIRIPRNRTNVWMLALFTALVLGCIYGSLSGAQPPLYYLLIWTRYGALLGFYFLLNQLVSNRRDLDAFLGGLVAGAFVAVLSAFLGEVKVHEAVERRSGIGAGSNQHAANMLLILPMIYALYLSVRWRLLKPFLLGTALLCVVGVVMAGSRSAFLAMLAMGGVWMLRFRRASDLKYVAVMVFVFLFSMLFASDAYLERLGTIDDSISAASGNTAAAARDAARFEVMRAAADAFVSSPLGAGVANFGPWAVRQGYKMSVEHTPHNASLQVASELGIVGLVPYLGILLLTWLNYSQAQRIARSLRMRRDEELHHLYMRAVLLQIGFVGIVIVAHFQPGFLWKGMWSSFGLGTTTLYLVQRRARELRATEPAAPSEAAAPVGGRLRAEPA